jgi:hypothetical protein
MGPDRAAKLVPSQRWRRLLIEEVASVELVVLNELEKG